MKKFRVSAMGTEALAEREILAETAEEAEEKYFDMWTAGEIDTNVRSNRYDYSALACISCHAKMSIRTHIGMRHWVMTWSTPRQKPMKGRVKMMSEHVAKNSIIQGDCIQVMAQMPAASVNFILTDPPYLVGYTSRDGRAVPNDDNDRWLFPAFKQMYRVLAADSFAVSFYGWTRADTFIRAWRAAGFRIVGHLVFAKPYASNSGIVKYQHEQAYVLAKGRPNAPRQLIGDVLKWEYSGNKLHPTQKPLAILKPLIQCFSEPESLVLDPMCGSDSSLLAAKSLFREYIGIELDKKYAAIATRRLEAV